MHLALTVDHSTGILSGESLERSTAAPAWNVKVLVPSGIALLKGSDGSQLRQDAPFGAVVPCFVKSTVERGMKRWNGNQVSFLAESAPLSARSARDYGIQCLWARQATSAMRQLCRGSQTSTRGIHSALYGSTPYLRSIRYAQRCHKWPASEAP
jgi:hypothetical protein